MTRSRSSTHIFAYVSDGLRINTLCRRSPAHENYTGPTQASCSQSRLNCFTASSPLQFLSETSDSRSMNSLLCDCELSLLLFSKSILFRFFFFFWLDGHEFFFNDCRYRLLKKIRIIIADV